MRMTTTRPAPPPLQSANRPGPARGEQKARATPQFPLVTTQHRGNHNRATPSVQHTPGQTRGKKKHPRIQHTRATTTTATPTYSTHNTASACTRPPFNSTQRHTLINRCAHTFNITTLPSTSPHQEQNQNNGLELHVRTQQCLMRCGGAISGRVRSGATTGRPCLVKTAAHDS
jgi:hypothetical protein